MLFFTALAYANFAVGMFAGFCSWALSRTPGWRVLRSFAYLSFTAGIYGLLDAIMLGAPDAKLSVTLVPINTLVGALHSVGWLYCSAWVVRRKPGRLDAIVASLVVGVGLAALIPGVIYEQSARVQHVPWAGVQHVEVTTKPLANFLLPLLAVPIVIALLRYVRRGPEKRGLRSRHTVGLFIFLLAGVNEVLVASEVYRGIYLADGAFLVVVATVTYDVLSSVASGARKLEDLSASLGTLVGERTAELSKMQEALVRTERLAAMGQHAATVGHEVNNPLSYLVSNVEYVRDELKGKASPDIESALDDALDGAARIRMVVKDLRAYALNTVEEEETVSAPACVASDAIRLTQWATKHRATVRLEKEAVGNTGICAQRLAQVLVNFIMNAAQAMPESRVADGSGKITVRVRPEGPRMVIIEVEDNGKGMNEETRQRIFDPFFTTKQNSGGTGLGLFVAHGIIKACGGKIDVLSEPGVGTTMRIELPVVDGHDARADDPGWGSGAVLAAKPLVTSAKVLVVDDDERVRRGMRRLLTDYAVDCAESAEQGMSFVDGDPSYDVILCDLMMPGATGMELFEEIRERRPELAERFLFVTGGATTGAAASFVASNQSRTLYKPVDAKVLHTKIEEIAGRHRSPPLPVVDSGRRR